MVLKASRRSSRTIVKDTHLKMHQCQFDEEDGEDELTASKNKDNENPTDPTTDPTTDLTTTHSVSHSSFVTSSPALNSSALAMLNDVQLASSAIKINTAEDTRKVKSFMSDEIWGRTLQKELPPTTDNNSARNSPPFLSISAQIATSNPEQTDVAPGLNVVTNTTTHSNIPIKLNIPQNIIGQPVITASTTHLPNTTSTTRNISTSPTKPGIPASQKILPTIAAQISLESLIKHVQSICPPGQVRLVHPKYILKQPTTTSTAPPVISHYSFTTNTVSGKPTASNFTISSTKPATTKFTIPVISKAAQNNEKRAHTKLTSPVKVLVTDCKLFKAKDTDVTHKKRRRPLGLDVVTSEKSKISKEEFISNEDKVDEYLFPDNKRKRKKEVKVEPVVKKKLRSGFAEENSWLQTKTCDSFPRLPKCLDCKEGTDGAYCRFTMFRRLYTLDSGKIKSAGFCTSDAAEADDLKPWIYQEDTTSDLPVHTCEEILKDIGAQFEQLVLQEFDAQKWTRRSGDIAWKRPVLQVRDMCDICATTIFNTHWTCESCGFSVCLDCYHHELDAKDSSDWPACNLEREHNIDELNITQSIPKNVLKDLYDDLLDVCRKIGLKFRQLDLLEFSHHRNVADMRKVVQPNMNNLDILATIANIEHDDHITDGAARNIFDTYQKLESNSECVWFCDGRMLHIQSSKFSDATMKVFKSEWRKGKPIIVSNVHHNLNKSLWCPKSFSDDFGHELGDIVNCYDGNVIENFSVAQFWKGFECVKERPVFNGESVSLLKLKDWPPGDDFKEKLPARFKDMMQALPAGEYTQRDGRFNLAARLPDFFAVPDLGPKMYNAYGSASYPSAGTTNLHLDISDATNVICYVGIPDEETIRQQEIQDTFTTVDKACCRVTQQRIRDPTVRPGALWHIFDAHDADKMRRFLIRISDERGMVLNENSDPIHDQSFYLDQDLLDRLREEEGVVGYPICQCLGDAVFIPAGAPHQVLNLHSCIKVAEDFVAPEHITHCFQLTQEFRHLSDYHTNHEDKLQIKNIIYHTVKDCLGVVKNHHLKTESKSPGTDC